MVSPLILGVFTDNLKVFTAASPTGFVLKQQKPENRLLSKNINRAITDAAA